MDLHKVLHELQCDDCSLIFLDYKQFLLHRKYHNSFFRSVVSERTLLEESCPLCFVKHFERYKDIGLGELLGSAKTSKGGDLEVMRCKYYPKCKAEFNRLLEFIKHLKDAHNDDKPYTCQQCDYTAPRYDNLKRHLFAHVGYKMFKCHLCGKEYARKESLKHHYVLSHEEVKIKSHDCSYCGKKFAIRTVLNKHLKIHLPNSKIVSETFKCDLCCKEFTAKRNLRDHLERHNNSLKNLKAFICGICSKGFASRGYLKRHELLHTENKPFSCDYCDKKFYKPSHRKRHQFVHLDKQPYECKECGHQFVWEISLRRHLDPDKESKKTLCCKKCPKKFKNLNCFTYHERSHREFLCEICNRKCFTPHGFKKHLKAHGMKIDNNSCSKTLIAEESPRPKNPIKCSLCPKEYRCKRDLRKHLLKHEGKEPYVCKHCGKRFMMETLLKTHLNPEKETKHLLCCKDCPATFKNINCLQHHKRSHMEEFSCEVCDVKYYTRDGFRKHLSKHKIDLDPAL